MCSDVINAIAWLLASLSKQFPDESGYYRESGNCTDSNKLCEPFKHTRLSRRCGGSTHYEGRKAILRYFVTRTVLAISFATYKIEPTQADPQSLHIGLEAARF